MNLQAPTFQSRRVFWIALAFLATLIFAGLGQVPLTDLDEGAFAEASREMLVRGDWVSPWLLDAPRFDKPALIHWLQMASFSAFGLSAWSARLPSGIAGLIWVGVMALWAQSIARRFFPQLNHQRVGLWALLMAGSSVGILAIARSSTADAVLNAFLVISLFSLWQAFYTDEKSIARKWARAAALFIALGLLTKGPIAVLIPAAVAVAGALSMKREGWSRLLALITDPLSWVIVVIVAAPWYWLQFQAQGMAFIYGFFGTHNLGRFTSTMHGFSSGPWYYPAWMLIALLPWVPIALWALVQLVRSGLWREKSLWMCWGIFVFVIVFFSFSATKLPHYGFYGLSGLLVIMALALEKQLAGADRKSSSILTIQHIFILTLLLLVSGAPLWWSYLPGLIADPYYREALQSAGTSISNQWAWFVLSIIVAIAIAFWRTVFSVMLGGIVFSAILYLGIVLSVIAALRAPILHAAQVVRTQSASVVTWRLTAPSLSFAAQRVIKPGDPGTGMMVVMHAKDHDLLLVRLKGQTAETLPVEIIWSEGGFQIVRIP